MCRRDDRETWQSIGSVAYEILQKVGGVRSRSGDGAGSAAHTRLAANDNRQRGEVLSPVTVVNEKGAGAEAARTSWPREDARQGTTRPAASGG